VAWQAAKNTVLASTERLHPWPFPAKMDLHPYPLAVGRSSRFVPASYYEVDFVNGHDQPIDLPDGL